jgi:N-acetyl-anhydromuramyl-L-alanine amidase AmpD
VVAADGTVYKCWPVTTRTYCVAGGNTASLCVCLVGNRQLMPAPPAQWRAAVELFRDLLRAYPGRRIYGHREAPTAPPQATACPGAAVDMDEFRRAVQDALEEMEA